MDGYWVLVKVKRMRGRVEMRNCPILGEGFETDEGRLRR
jgi:hypothetical protein